MKRSATWSLLVLLGGLLAANAPPAAATDISIESRTYIPARGLDGGDAHVPLYEYLSFSAEDVAMPGVYLRGGGWGRVDLADETYGDSTNSELQYGFIGWRGPRNNAEARLGRISLTSGVARNEVFDGLLVGSDLPAGFDVTAFGGVPVETDGDGRTDDTLYGGRLSQGRPGVYRIGASYLKEESAKETFREEAGGDVFVAPLPFLELVGASLYNVADDGWARHDYRLALGPFAGVLNVVGTWVSTDYDRYFVSPVNPAFSAFTPGLTPGDGEKLDRIGGEVELSAGHGVMLTGEYTAYAYEIAGSAQAYGGKLDWTGATATAGAGYRQMHGDAEENRYQHIRAYATKSFGALHAGLGVEHVIYDVELNGEKTATTGTVALDYALSRSLQLTVSGGYGVTPQYEEEVTGLLALIWRYDAAIKKGGSQ